MCLKTHTRSRIIAFFRKISDNVRTENNARSSRACNTDAANRSCPQPSNQHGRQTSHRRQLHPYVSFYIEKPKFLQIFRRAPERRIVKRGQKRSATNRVLVVGGAVLGNYAGGNFLLLLEIEPFSGKRRRVSATPSPPKKKSMKKHLKRVKTLLAESAKAVSGKFDTI